MNDLVSCLLRTNIAVSISMKNMIIYLSLNDENAIYVSCKKSPKLVIA
jgi:hypothetical protein